MSEEIDPFDLIRAEARSSEPADSVVERARRRLRTAMAAEGKTRRLARRRYALVAASAVVVLGVLIALIAPPSQVEATLVEIARAARVAAPHEAPQGSFLYTNSERVDLVVRPGQDFAVEADFVAYLLSSTREVWRSPGFIQLRTTATSVSFFDPDHRDAYYARGLDVADQIGLPVLERFTEVTDPVLEHDWPTVPPLLRQEMEDFTSHQTDRTLSSRILALAAAMLREADLTPELRGAVFEVLSGLDLEVDEDANLVILRAASGTGEIIELTVDRKGDLVAEATTLLLGDPALGVPDSTVTSSARYLVKTMVTNLLSPP